MNTNYSFPNFFSSEPFGCWDGLTKASVENSKQLETLNVKLTEKLVKKQTAFFDKAVAASHQIVAMLSEKKALSEVITAQRELAAEFSNSLLALTRETSEIIVESQEEYRHWFEQGLKNLMSKAPISETPKASPTKKAA